MHDKILQPGHLELVMNILYDQPLILRELEDWAFHKTDSRHGWIVLVLTAGRWTDVRNIYISSGIFKQLPLSMIINKTSIYHRPKYRVIYLEMEIKCFLDFFFSFVNLLSLSSCERTQVSFIPASMHRVNLNNKSQ